MYIKIHRGTRQIGGSIIEVGTENTKIILDCGTNLPAHDGTPIGDNIEIEGLTRGANIYSGVFISHYHGDHCGMLKRINKDIPIYTSAETKSVLTVISDFIKAPPPRIDNVLESGKPVVVGDIEILPLPVTHSAYGALMFLISADCKRVLYTGDFQSVGIEDDSEVGHIDMLLCEGTNISGKDGITEDDVRERATQAMRRNERPVFALSSAVNINRIKSIAQACAESGRTLAVDPFQDAILNELGVAAPRSALGFVWHSVSEEKSPRAHKHLHENMYRRRRRYFSVEKIARKEKLTFMVRQKMGDFIENLNNYMPLSDATFIYSIWHGYKAHPDIQKLLNICAEKGIKIVDIHASGHVYKEDLQQTISRLRPAALVPIHTEAPEAFSEFHNNVIIPEDGEIITV